MTSKHDKKRATMARNLDQATGRSLDDWVALVGRFRIDGFLATVDWLKEEHGLGQARLITETIRDRAEE